MQVYQIGLFLFFDWRDHFHDRIISRNRFRSERFLRCTDKRLTTESPRQSAPRVAVQLDGKVRSYYDTLYDGKIQRIFDIGIKRWD